MARQFQEVFAGEAAETCRHHLQVIATGVDCNSTDRCKWTLCGESAPLPLPCNAVYNPRQVEILLAILNIPVVECVTRKQHP